MMAHRSRLSLMAFLPTHFECSVKGDAKSYFSSDSTRCWFVISNQVLRKGAFTPLSHQNLMKLKISCIRDAVSNLLAALRASGRTSFQVRYSTSYALSCFPVLISCCRNIQGGKDMSAFKHGIVGRIASIRCLITTVAI